MTEHKYKVGDKVFVDTSQSGKLSGYAGEVVKVTKTGLFDVRNERGTLFRFRVDGFQLMRPDYAPFKIVDNARKDKIVHEMTLVKIEREIDNQVRNIISAKRDVIAIQDACNGIKAQISYMKIVLEEAGE